MDETGSSVPTFSHDAQAAAPATRVSLSRVGVTGVEKVIRVCGAQGAPGREAEEAPFGAGNGSAVANNLQAGLYHAELECLVDLNPEQKGVHMSRFEEVVNEAIDEVVLSESLRAEGLAAHIAERVRERQGGLRSEVRISARYPETKPAPVSEIPTQEIYTLFGTAVASERGTRTLTGVEAQGMTACPCAQGLVEDGARERLAGRGYSPEQIDEIVDTVPLATHNQRGIGRLYIGRPEDSGVEIDARDLLAIVEQSMSSEIYELMKRSDERFVVEKAHANPRFVEDCVREMVRRVVEAYPELASGCFVQARQENLETIHRHNVVAERYGLLSEIAAELDGGEHSRHHTTMREWLEAPSIQAAG
ncbi:MAG: GTP cyclohydrolase I FolE2 [Actinobacteria bacterium]|nr:GTP cyclohydrolase I FolE2 [Actinomycetota bacterium]